MKKIIATGLILVSMLGVLASCEEETFACNLCEKEFSGTTFEVEVDGETKTVCYDCYSEISNQEIQQQLENILSELEALDETTDAE